MKTILKSIVVSLLLLSLVLSMNLERVNAAVGDAPKATWLWHTQEIAQQADQYLDFMATNHVDIVYLQVDRSIEDSIYHSFIQQASTLHIEVHALDGSSRWAKDDGMAKAQQFFDWVEAYQESAPPAAKFTGIHLDVEPYTLKEWTSQYDQTVLNFQNLMVASKERAIKMQLPLAADIPFWFDKRFYNNEFGNGVLSEWLIDNTDTVAIMAYRDTAIGSNGIIELIRSEMDYAASVGKRISIAVETTASSEGAYLTFFEEGKQRMEQELSAVQQAYQNHTSFNGFSIHSLHGWMSLDE